MGRVVIRDQKNGITRWRKNIRSRAVSACAMILDISTLPPHHSLRST